MAKKPTIGSSMRVPKAGETTSSYHPNVQKGKAGKRPKATRTKRATRAPIGAAPTALTTVETMSDAEPVVHVMCRMPKSMHKDLKRLALDRDTNIQALLIEATEGILAKYR